MKNNSTPNQSRVEEYVLIEYLMAFLPADQPDGDDVLLKSTQDIQDDLSDMVELSLILHLRCVIRAITSM